MAPSLLSVIILLFLPSTVFIHVCLSLCFFCLSPILSHPPSLSALPSEFSEVVDLFTSCSVPLPPFPPELEMAGVTWLCLKWQRPASSPKEDDIFYILEMEEEGSVCLLRKPKIIWSCEIVAHVWNSSMCRHCFCKILCFSHPREAPPVNAYRLILDCCVSSCVAILSLWKSIKYVHFPHFVVLRLTLILCPLCPTSVGVPKIRSVPNWNKLILNRCNSLY